MSPNECLSHALACGALAIVLGLTAVSLYESGHNILGTIAEIGTVVAGFLAIGNAALWPERRK